MSTEALLQERVCSELPLFQSEVAVVGAGAVALVGRWIAADRLRPIGLSFLDEGPRGHLLLPNPIVGSIPPGEWMELLNTKTGGRLYLAAMRLADTAGLSSVLDCS